MRIYHAKGRLGDGNSIIIAIYKKQTNGIQDETEPCHVANQGKKRPRKYENRLCKTQGIMHESKRPFVGLGNRKMPSCLDSKSSLNSIAFARSDWARKDRLKPFEGSLKDMITVESILERPSRFVLQSC